MVTAPLEHGALRTLDGEVPLKKVILRRESNRYAEAATDDGFLG